MKVGIIGAGAWGTALACSVQRVGHDVVLWAFEAADAAKMQKVRRNDLLPGVAIPTEIFITNDIGVMRETDVWIIAVPSEFFSETTKRARGSYEGQPIIIATKGIDPDGMLLSQIANESLSSKIGILSGPGFARELAEGRLTGSAIAGRPEVINVAQEIFADIVLENTDDMVGIQLCAAGKNVAAVLIGYLDGQGAGENERALKLCQVWGEVVSLGLALDADRDTFLGLAGIGDLFLSATSRTSRNYKAGLDLANGKAPAGTVEGIMSLRGLLELAEKAGIFTPNIEFLADLTGV
jgi:glycerol-3-phosphate dehydrogenase (NAD(P)+)